MWKVRITPSESQGTEPETDSDLVGCGGRVDLYASLGASDGEDNACESEMG
jgi:hypothetical protein